MNLDTLTGRLKFMNSILDGSIKIKGGKIRTLSESQLFDEPCNAGNLIKKFGGVVNELGSGAYGTVYDLCLTPGCEESFAMKQTILNPDEEDIDEYISNDNPLRPDNVEVEIFRRLNELLLLGVTPHIPRYLGDALCDKEGEISRITFVEKASGNFHSYILKTLVDPKSNLTLEERRKQWKALLFQLIYTMKVIYKRFPTFRHNDFHTGNLLYFDTSGKGNYEYIVNGKSHIVPDIGVSLAVWDFDMASMTGEIENLKVLKWNGQHGIKSEPNVYWDIHKVLNTIMTVVINRLLRKFITGFNIIKTIPDEVYNFINKIIPKDYQGRSVPNSDEPWLITNYYSLGIRLTVMTPEQILNDPYFDEYRKAKRENIVEVYNDSDATTKYQVPAVKAQAKLDIKCPEFKDYPYFEYRQEPQLQTQDWSKRQACSSTRNMPYIIDSKIYKTKMVLDEDPSGNSRMKDIISSWMLNIIPLYDDIINYLTKFNNISEQDPKTIVQMAQSLVEAFLDAVYVPTQYVQLVATLALNKALFYQYRKHILSLEDNKHYSEGQILDLYAQFNMFLQRSGIENNILERFSISSLN